MKKLTLIAILLLVFLAGCGATDDGETDYIADAEAFLGNLQNGEFDAARKNFDQAMDSQLSTADLEEMWASITEQLGPFQEQSDSRIEEEGEYQMVYLTCVFEKETINMRVVYNQDGQIAGLQFLPVSATE